MARTPCWRQHRSSTTVNSGSSLPCGSSAARQQRHQRPGQPLQLPGHAKFSSIKRLGQVVWVPRPNRTALPRPRGGPEMHVRLSRCHLNFLTNRLTGLPAHSGCSCFAGFRPPGAAPLRVREMGDISRKATQLGQQHFLGRNVGQLLHAIDIRGLAEAPPRMTSLSLVFAKSAPPPWRRPQRLRRSHRLADQSSGRPPSNWLPATARRAGVSLRTLRLTPLLRASRSLVMSATVMPRYSPITSV